MQKKTLLAIVLSAAVFILYYQFFAPPPPKPVPGRVETVAAVPGSSPSPQAAPVQTETAESAAPPASRPVVVTAMENPILKTELSSQSGLPGHWWLKKYFLTADRKGPNIDLLAVTAPQLPLQWLFFSGQKPVDPYFAAQGTPTATGALYQGEAGPLAVQERIELGKVDYSAEVTLNLENRSSQPQTVAPGIRLTVDQTRENGKGFWFFKEAPNPKFPLYRLGSSVVRHANVAKLGPWAEETGEIAWAGLEDRYFLKILLARSVSPQNRAAYGVTGSEVFTQLQYPPETIGPGQKKEYAFTLYLGPKDHGLLKSFGAAHLDKAIDYGWFGWVALPILYVLKFFYSFLHNWGLAIIFMTIFIKILLNPLTNKSMQSMKAMQNLQPQLQKLREKYKDDRERLNQETMSLFKTHKVNPMGGCLPMLLQMPIYIALYKVLYNATDLYHAPFFGFYRDLSAPDPYFILPILLGVFMVLQQKMSPSMGDPTQAKMMMLMPVLFAGFMLFLPLGLVLYIFVNTVMTVVQQYMNQKNISLLSLIRRKPG
jgi:YidC/Oxa1 family membrane protein insertase